MARALLPSDRLIALLEAGPARLMESTRGLSPELLQSRPAPADWSPNEVLAHLRSCADVWGGCIARILAEDQPTIRAVNPRGWAKQTEYLETDFAISLKEFTRQRNALLEVLTGLSAEQWVRTATVTGAGRPLVRSVHSYADWLATHEQPHIKQIERAVALHELSRAVEGSSISDVGCGSPPVAPVKEL